MSNPDEILGSRMGRRIAATMAAVVFVPMLVAASVLVAESYREVQAAAERALATDAQAFAADFAARLRGGGDSADTGAELSLQPAWRGENSRGRLALLDADGRLVFSATPLPDPVVEMLGRIGRGSAAQPDTPLPLAWQTAGVEWHGALARIPPAGWNQPAWSVAVFEPYPTWIEATLPVAGALIALLLVSIAMIVLGALALIRRYVPPTLALREALTAAGPQSLSRVATSLADELGDAIEGYNASAVRLVERLRALETLSEIDRLLLGSSELEQMIDAILSRVRSVTRCHGVAITLIDADSPAHGRVYFTAADVVDIPVTRVELDPDMLATLAASPDGITVARCEAGRHSLLLPLAELGSEFFWAWPVMSGDRLVAVLALGYCDAPAAEPALARYGADFAARLSAALSNSARDEQLYRQAHYDALTSLPNRLLFRDRLAQELASASAGGQRGALLYIDLDHFKRVNDTVGHAAGDQLLTIVAQRLRASVKDTDTVARLGGDEFTVILRQISDPEAVRTVADRIIAGLESPVNVAGRDHSVRASIGMTLFPDDAVNIDELMRHADTAMYRAKELGRGRSVFFDRALTARQVSATGSGLYRALRHREFSLFYQPQFRVDDGALVGLEALLRWQTPRDGLKYPAEFVPAAEECGLIVDIGGWVLEAACTQFALWREQGMQPPRLAINISVQQLRAADFPGDLRRLLARYAIPAGTIELEFTEAVLSDGDVAGVLEELASDGVRLVLDDFGVGETSLTHLRQYPITVVKIDRTLIDEIARDSTAATLGATVIAMARAMGKTVVAEGVETVEQLDYLREQECDVVQGFYLARPLTAAAVGELLAGRLSLAHTARSRLAG